MEVRVVLLLMAPEARSTPAGSFDGRHGVHRVEGRGVTG
jgi:hypothetical protein